MRCYFTRTLALAVAFALALALLPSAALAAPATEVWVGDEKVSDTPGGYWKSDNAGGLMVCAETDAWNVHYATATAGNVLTLKDAAITEQYDRANQMCGVYANGDLTIHLPQGTASTVVNSLGVITPSGRSIGVYVAGDLTVTGGGGLTATGGEASGKNGRSAGVDVGGDLTVTGGGLTGTGGAASGYGGVSAGVDVVGTLAIADGTLTGMGGAANDEDGRSTGVRVAKNLNITGGGALTGTGGTAGTKGGHSVGVDVPVGGVTMNGGKLVGTGGAAYLASIGMHVNGALDIRGGGTLTVTGGGASGEQGYSVGVRVMGSLAITGGGTLTGTGGEASGAGGASTGVDARDGIDIRGGDLTGTGGAAQSESFGVCLLNGGVTMNGGKLVGTGGQSNDESTGVSANGATVTINGGKLVGTGGTATGARGKSYGVDVGASGAITVGGGTLVGQSPGGGAYYAQAFNKAPAIGPAYTDARVWYGADEEAAGRQGPQDQGELAAHYAEKYAYIGEDGPAAPPPPPPTPAPVAAAGGPNYRYRTLRDGATGIEVSGYFSEDAALSVKEATLHPAGACAACDAIRARQAAGGLVLLWDVILATGGYSGGFEMRFPVGAKHNGQAVTLLHCRNNMLESQSVLVGNGVAAGMFGGFSPFAVAVDGSAAGIPKTGDGPALWLGAALLLLAAGGCALAVKKRGA